MGCPPGSRSSRTRPRGLETDSSFPPYTYLVVTFLPPPPGGNAPHTPSPSHAPSPITLHPPPGESVTCSGVDSGLYGLPCPSSRFPVPGSLSCSPCFIRPAVWGITLYDGGRACRPVPSLDVWRLFLPEALVIVMVDRFAPSRSWIEVDETGLVYEHIETEGGYMITRLLSPLRQKADEPIRSLAERRRGRPPRAP